jgi:hypothetical protein
MATPRKPTGGRFRPGKSGNPAGRPPGIPDKRVALRALLEPHAPALIQKVVALAKKGDRAALRMCLDRLVPPLRATDQPVAIEGLNGSLTDQGRVILVAMGKGDLAPDVAVTLIQALGALAGVVKVDDLEKRLAAIEEDNMSSLETRISKLERSYTEPSLLERLLVAQGEFTDEQYLALDHETRRGFTCILIEAITPIGRKVVDPALRFARRRAHSRATRRCTLPWPAYRIVLSALEVGASAMRQR